MALASTWKCGFNPLVPSAVNLTYARSIGAATVAARQPAGFATGGSCAWVYNSSTTLLVLVTFYNFVQDGAFDPVLVFPVDGAPPTGQPGIVVPPNTTRFIEGIGSADSFAAIGSAAGPTLIYVQRGEGTGP